MNQITIGAGLSKGNPCKDCKDRQVGCHGKCKAYIDFKENAEKLKEKMQKEADAANSCFKGSMTRYKSAGSDLRKRSSRASKY